MKKSLFILCAAMLAAGVACAFEISLYSGKIPLPGQNGSFTDKSTLGHSVHHAYLVLTAEKYIYYTNSTSMAADIFADYLSLSQGMDLFFDETTTDGYTILPRLSEYIDEDNWWGYDEDAYFAGIFIYVDESLRTNYIARAVSVHTPLESEDVNEWGLEIGVKRSIENIAVDAGKWQVIYNEPPSITCTDLCVTGGVVSATYSISEFSRLNEVVSGEETSVIVAADLARTTQTNLAASVTATNSVDSTFTFSFNPAEQNWTNSTLFIFGVVPPR